MHRGPTFPYTLAVAVLALLVGGRLAAGTSSDPVDSGRGPSVCQVPAVFTTIQSAVDDVACSEIVVAAGSFAELIEIARPLTLRGASAATTTIDGRVRASGAGTVVDLRDLTIDGSGPHAVGCFRSVLVSEAGADIEAVAVDVANSGQGLGSACLIFADGFESGDVDGWSETGG